MHSEDEEVERENLAQTLVRELPKAQVVVVERPGQDSESSVAWIALPRGTELKKIDDEQLLAHPRRTQAIAAISTLESFLEYVAKHAQPESVIWCAFNPQTFTLGFTLIVDEHAPTAPGWRAHRATYTPEMSTQWKTWLGANKQSKSQLEFAEFLERNERDVAAVDGYPSSLDMMKLATEFEASSEKRVKSIVRLQGGGVRLDYVEDDDAATLQALKLFERFAIGMPIFWAGAGYRIDARLKYRQSSGKVCFWYELIRPDIVHEAAARELIDAVRDGAGSVPLLMGTCT